MIGCFLLIVLVVAAVVIGCYIMKKKKTDKPAGVTPQNIEVCALSYVANVMLSECSDVHVQCVCVCHM